MRNTHFHFTPHDCTREPYIHTLIDYTNDGSEGCIHFNGHYYVNNIPQEEITREMEYDGLTKYGNSIPQKLGMYFYEQEEEPYLIEDVSSYKIGDHIFNGGQISHYNTIEEYAQEIEIYMIEYVKDTSVYSEEDDDDGGTMNVCFFPSKEQKIYFRVLKVVDIKK